MTSQHDTDPPEPALDEFHQHEVLHLSSVLCNVIGQELIEHPWTQANPEALKALESAMSAMADAYQIVSLHVAPAQPAPTQIEQEWVDRADSTVDAALAAGRKT